MNKLVTGFALTALLALAAPDRVKAGGFGGMFSSPSCSSCGANQPSYAGCRSCNSHQVPTFMAAPWYLYWPYDAHFQTPAPVHAPYFAPPMYGMVPTYPYYPGYGGTNPGYAPGFGTAGAPPVGTVPAPAVTAPPATGAPAAQR
jgi:hypothetical protein